VKEPAGILVVGAGPAGLTLALQAHDHGAAVRIIDRRPEAARPSRALILHSRTLEVLRPLGVTQALLDRADIAPTADLQLGSRVVRATLADLALPDTAFPHLTLIRQMDVERVLAQALADRGIRVEHGTELARVRGGPEGARVTLRSPAVTEEILCSFVAGCDGPASTVRAQAGIGWPGRPYPVEVILADAELDGDLADGAARVIAGRRGLLFAFRLGEQAPWRLLATRPAGPDPLPPGQFGPAVPAAELQALMDQAGLRAQLTGLAWSSRIRLQHRVASRFRHGRLYLAGDAAHAYSPATGQGMNAAIQDAANLGWKLAFASRPGSGPLPDSYGPLLDSYDLERRPAARRVLAMTHLVFWAEAATGPVASALRGRLAPVAAPVVPALLGRRRLVAEGIRLISQLRVSYRGSPLSVEGTPRRPGGPRAGERLPDQLVTAAGRSIRLHDLLARPGVHILLDRDADWPDTPPPGRFIHVHRLDSVPGRGLIAVRPDGYIGFRCQAAEAGQLAAWLTRLRAWQPEAETII
jgi:2-polyprenyl-6-methoxyphenol hydroxylase-like FAD-dependent oxidoreductase